MITTSISLFFLKYTHINKLTFKLWLKATFQFQWFVLFHRKTAIRRRTKRNGFKKQNHRGHGEWICTGQNNRLSSLLIYSPIQILFDLACYLALACFLNALMWELTTIIVVNSHIKIFKINHSRRHNGAMVGSLDIRWSSPGSSPHRDHCVMILGKILKKLLPCLSQPRCSNTFQWIKCWGYLCDGLAPIQGWVEISLFKFHTLYKFWFSDWLICTIWHWVMTKQPPWRHYHGVIIAVV